MADKSFESADSAREAVLHRFEDALAAGAEPKIEEFLSEATSDRAELLVELVHIDLEYRIKAGQSVRVESYLWPDEETGELPLQEEYTYLKLRLNAGLSDADFAPNVVN